MTRLSPLRYPGGKSKLHPFFQKLIVTNGLTGHAYAEPFAGGASLALALLESGTVSHVHINDLDPAIYCFWWHVLNKPEPLISSVINIKVTPDEWLKQKNIFKTTYADLHSPELAFATLFLNRTNHSGILNGGMIGGKRQSGDYKLDVRFNPSGLAERIKRIADRADQISLYNIEAMDFLAKLDAKPNVFFYLDPPYTTAGKRLYLNTYSDDDHRLLKDRVVSLLSPWVLSYDDSRVIRSTWRGVKHVRLEMLHTARQYKVGRELMFFPATLRVPRKLLAGRSKPLSKVLNCAT